MIKAVLWDFGGVLTTSPFEAFNQYEKEHNIPQNFIRGVNATNPKTNAWAKMESNQISIVEFDKEFEEESRAAGYAIPGGDVLTLLVGAVRPEMVNALKKCKEQFIVACITNNIKSDEKTTIPHSKNQVDQYMEIMELFDEVIESAVEGVRKPNPEIYRIALSRLNINPEECVFLDDLGINLKPAKTMGMKTIKVLNVEQALKELGDYTGLSFI